MSASSGTVESLNTDLASVLKLPTNFNGFQRSVMRNPFRVDAVLSCVNPGCAARPRLCCWTALQSPEPCTPILNSVRLPQQYPGTPTGSNIKAQGRVANPGKTEPATREPIGVQHGDKCNPFGVGESGIAQRSVDEESLWHSMARSIL